MRHVNLPAILIIALLLFAILASTGTAVIAMRSGDPELPGEYHWEGDRLDHDFAQSQRAQALNVRAHLRLEPVQGQCHAQVQVAGPLPSELVLRLIHGSRPDLDEVIRLQQGKDGYEGRCEARPAGPWHLELGAADGSWNFRQDVTGDLARIDLAARGAPQT